jgi:uncharacterized protein (DUF1499 family)
VRALRWAALALLAVAVAGAAYVRLAPDDPTLWHVDPLAASGPAKPNAYRVGPAEGVDAPAPVYAVPAHELAAAFDAMALSQPRTTRLAGDPEALWATYVQRSLFMRFPDYVSVRFVDQGEGRSTLALFSRARYGRSDLGVNRARVEDWLSALDLPEG